MFKSENCSNLKKLIFKLFKFEKCLNQKKVKLEKVQIPKKSEKTRQIQPENI
jgi:hypothetical protein